MGCSTSSRRIITSHTYVPEEYDAVDKEVMFYLFTIPISNAVFAYAERQHRALVAVFKDGSVRTMDGFESAGILIPNYYKECPPESKRGKYWKLIAMKSSPFKLREVAIRNSLNGTTYCSEFNNCHDWIIAAAYAISSNLSDALRYYRRNGVLNIIEKTGQSSTASSRASSDRVGSILKILAENDWSDPTNLAEHKLE